MPSDHATAPTPLAPSVEKAYYRKCIQLKRRLNEVEAANDELKIRRVRLERGIQKMRLERAFLLDEVRKRMEYDVDGSEASDEEGITTPPPERPHRDKRRRTQPSQPAGQPSAPPSSHAHQPAAYPPSTVQRMPSQPEAPGSVPLVPGPNGMNVPANARDADGRYVYVPPHELAAMQQPANPPAAYPSHPPAQYGSPYGAPVGVPGGADRHSNGLKHETSEDREPPAAAADANGDRRIVSSTSADNANVEAEQ